MQRSDFYENSKRKVKLNYNQYILLGGQRHLWYFIQSVKESSQEAHHLVWKTNTQVNKNIKMNMINTVIWLYTSYHGSQEEKK